MDTMIRSELESQITQSRYRRKLTGAKPPLRPKHVWAVRTNAFNWLTVLGTSRCLT